MAPNNQVDFAVIDRAFVAAGKIAISLPVTVSKVMGHGPATNWPAVEDTLIENDAFGGALGWSAAPADVQ